MLKDRYLSNDPFAWQIYEVMQSKPIISPHGHIDVKVLLENKAFTNPVELLITPDHYITRLLYSQGISYEALGLDGSEKDPKQVWQLFADNYHLFQVTPSRIWLQEILYTLFGVNEVINSSNAGQIYEVIDAKLKTKEFLPQSLFNRFNIEVLATTDSTSADLSDHKKLQAAGLSGRVIPTFRPDDISDPSRSDWKDALSNLSKRSGIETSTFANLLAALRKARSYFIEHGATATDHGVYSAQTLKLDKNEAQELFQKLLAGDLSKENVEKFRAAILFEHGVMSAEDGLVMQLHPGSLRNYDKQIFDKYGPDKGFDIPVSLTFTKELQPLLNEVGREKKFKMVLYTLDESTYTRELAPLAGVYPSIRLGPPWWFLDSFNGTNRWRDAVTDTAGFYNTVGFIDDTRAFCSVPVRHDLARRMDALYLAKKVSEGLLTQSEALSLAPQLAYQLSKDFFNL
jgi:glucuronate isomerase